MMPAMLNTERRGAPGHIRLRPRPATFSLADLPYLEMNSHRPDVQRFLVRAIREGRVRVRPWPGAPTRVRITRVMEADRDVRPLSSD